MLALRRERLAIREQCETAVPRITHLDIAARARVDRTTVVHFFSGRRSPRSVPLAIELLLRERREAQAS